MHKPPFLHSLSHLSIGVSPKAFKKGKINTYPDGVYVGVYKGRFAGALLWPTAAH